MEPADVLEDAVVTVSDETYAVCRTETAPSTAFATIRTATETTVVVEETALDAFDATDVERGWRRLTFEVELPFDLVGFLATVATALAEADVPVFVLSAHRTDHVLVKTAHLETAVTRLEALGCTVAD
jgi:hypothetical protein